MITQLKDVLENVIEGNLGIPRVMEEYKITSMWSRVNSAGVTENAQPDKFVDGILYVNVKNSTWGQQINLLKSDIMIKLNAAFGKRVVKDIKVKAGVFRSKEEPKNEIAVKACGICSAEFRGEGNVCPVCSRKIAFDKNVKLIRFVNAHPKTNYADARQELQGTSETEFHRARRDQTAKKTDEKILERRQRGRKTK